VTKRLDQPQPAGERDACEPLRFERRQCDRWGLEGVATVFELAGDGFGRMHTLKMLDYSEGGLGAVSDTVIPLGSTVSIGFQAPGYIAKRGVVMRCAPCGHGYHVAIGFEQRLAA